MPRGNSPRRRASPAPVRGRRGTEAHLGDKGDQARAPRAVSKARVSAANAPSKSFRSLARISCAVVLVPILALGISLLLLFIPPIHRGAHHLSSRYFSGLPMDVLDTLLLVRGGYAGFHVARAESVGWSDPGMAVSFNGLAAYSFEAFSRIANDPKLARGHIGFRLTCMQPTAYI